MGDLLSGLLHLDRAAFLLLNGGQHPLLDAVMPLLSRKEYAIVPAVALVIALARIRGRRAWLLVLAALLAVGIGDLTANTLKGVFERIRPCHVLAQARVLAGCTTSFALPSNHAVNMAALAGVAWAGSRLLGALLLALAVLVAYSRVYLGVHYPGDVLAGLLYGAGIGVGVAWAVRRLAGCPGASASAVDAHSACDSVEK